MPNRHFAEMGDCNVSRYTSPKNDEKYCKYSYPTWCATCEKSSPRRRSRSETNEPCSRKRKEMKCPRRYNNRSGREYENMELEYEPRGQCQWPLECCRIRSNLCELPTSYISNNCQISTPRVSNDTSSFADRLKSVTTYEQTLKFADLNERLENLSGMQDKSRTSPGKQEYNMKPCKRMEKSPSACVPSRSPAKRLDCREHCPLVQFKYHELSDRRVLCYDTGTYFDRSPESSCFTERYSSEVEYLREKLKLLKNRHYSEKNNEERIKAVSQEVVEIVNKNDCGDIANVSVFTSSLEVRRKKRDKKVIFPSSCRSSKSRVSLKTRNKVNTVKLKKIKAKPQNSTSIGSICNESECSGSDSEHEIDETYSNEELDSASDGVLDESVKNSTNGVRSVNDSIVAGSGDCSDWPVRLSLFPHIPPYVRFNSHDSESEFKVPGGGKRHFKWKLSTITPVVVRKTLTNSGFALVRKSNQWLGTWGKHMKSPMFKTLKDNQKLNHFPGTFQLGRKDRLWRNFQKMIVKYGHKEFGFLPHTYVLPQELKLLKQNWEFKNGSGGEMWIIKPPASARGVGIKVINKWSQLPKKTSLVVQKYVSNPFLINGSKFDLRLYVLVTSFHPLRVYLYPDGLARFASSKYSDDVKDLKDRYMHLTNYSINKLSNTYTANEDANACQGHKWTISKLMEYLEMGGINTKVLWKNLQQLVIKTMISCEPPITELCEENTNNKYNCYELFGVDVLLDDNLKPWLLEVNISPSLHSASPLDAHVKGPLVQTLFDLAQFHLPPRLAQTMRQAPQCFEPKIYTNTFTKKERLKHVYFTQMERREDYLQDILRELTGDDVRHLTRAEDEYAAKGRFERIFPTAQTYRYLQFMEPRYYNRLFDAWEAKYSSKREEGIAVLQSLCSKKIHLKVAPQSSLKKSLPNMIHSDTNVQPTKEVQNRPLEDIMKDASIRSKVTVN